MVSLFRLPFSFSRPGRLTVALGLAAVGQYFLAQNEVPTTVYWGCLFFLFAVILFVSAGLSVDGSPVSDHPLTIKKESLLFAGAMGAAIFFRLYRIDQFPAAVFPDQAFNGWTALRILNEGWKPVLGDFDRSNGVSSYCYLLASWFSLVRPSQVSYFLFSVLEGLLTLPLIYWAIRQLSGPRTALTTLFILGVMRWHITFCRNGHIAIQVPLLLAGALAFWLYALKSDRRPLVGFMGAALCTGASLGTYQAGKAALILMTAALVYEFMKGRIQQKALAYFLAAFPVFLILSWPLWADFCRTGSLTHRPEASIFPWIWQGGATRILQHFSGTALMFNRTGETYGLLNLPGHRMLDDVTGVFWVLGFFYCLSSILRREHFYPVVGMAAFCLPALLSNAPAGASRAFGCVPFVAWLAAIAIETVRRRLDAWKPGQGFTAGSLAIFLILGTMALGNFKDYFLRQARNTECWQGTFSAEGSAAGRAIARNGDGYEYYLASHFYGRYDVQFLGYSQRAHLHRLDLPDTLAARLPPAKRGILFILDEGKWGVLRLLKDLYPGGETERFTDLQGHTLVYFYRVPPDASGPGGEKARRFLSTPFGLRGEYFSSLEKKQRPSAVRFDPLLNFTFRGDFPSIKFPPLTVVWSGYLTIPLPGSYRFIALTTDSVKMTVDGKEVLVSGNVETSDIHFRGGSHRIRVLFQKTAGVDTALSVLWRRPGALGFEAVPFTAFQRSR